MRRRRQGARRDDHDSAEVVGGDPTIQGLTRQAKDADELPLGTGIRVKCLHTPCHTSGHMSYLATASDGSAAVFTGDILFVGGCGRFFEGTPEQMLQSAKTLGALAPETKVFCGHEYTGKNLEFAFDVDPENPAVIAKRTWAEATRAKGGRTVPSTIGEELTYNPFMRVDRVVRFLCTRAMKGMRSSGDLRRRRECPIGSCISLKPMSGRSSSRRSWAVAM